MEYCLDTNVIIEYFKDENSTASRFIVEFSEKVRFFVTSITVYELLFGPKYGGYEKELDDINSFLLWVTVLPFDLESAKIAAGIDAMLHKKGKPVGLRDVFIAAICWKNKVPIVTRNVSHFNTIVKETTYSLGVLTPEKAMKNLS